ncbi:MAG: peptide-methionine (S)-S-oxide reductase [Roseovarius sp.]
MELIGFGGGCHWCTEAVFASLRGVERVEQGFIRSAPPDDTWSEAVRIAFDPARIALDVLVEVHLRTHASTSNHKMRGKYRSAVYSCSDDQAEAARVALAALQPGYDAPLVTRVLPLGAFRASPEQFRSYYLKQAGGPFCARYIDPKLDLLRARFAEHVS